MYEKILVPFDGSEPSEEAIDRAEALANKFDSELHILTVVEPQIASDGATTVEDLMIDDTYLEEEITAYKELHSDIENRININGPVITELKVGVISDEILDYTNIEGMDLLVMGTHGRTGMSRLLLGSVTETLVRRSSVPVLTIR